MVRGLELATRLRGLAPAVDQALSWVGQLPFPLPRYEGPLRFIHHDLSPEHLVVDAGTGGLVGILDWTDAALGDAAREFVTLVTSRGWQFAEEVLRNYRVPLGRAFREWLRFMVRLLSVIWLAEAYAQDADVAKHITWVIHAFSGENASY